MTGAEIDLTEVDARKIVDAINAGVATVWTLVTLAYDGRAWLALGYPSWDQLCEAEFDSARLRLPREEREEIVASLRAKGMSIRAIGSALGVANNTVRSDLVSQIDTPDTVTGLDGKQYAASQDRPPEPQWVDAEEVPLPLEEPQNAPATSPSHEPRVSLSPSFLRHQKTSREVQPTEEGAAFLEQWLDTPDARTRAFATAVLKRINQAHGLFEVDVKDFAATDDEDLFSSLEHLVDGLTRYRDQVRKLRHPHLASVKEIR